MLPVYVHETILKNNMQESSFPTHSNTINSKNKTLWLQWVLLRSHATAATFPRPAICPTKQQNAY